MIIYASAPTMSVVGIARIKTIIELSPEEMWEQFSPMLGIDRNRYDECYRGFNKAIGIELDAVRSLVAPITLKELREEAPSFHPPQIYRYVTNTQICSVLTRYCQSLKDCNK